MAAATVAVIAFDIWGARATAPVSPAALVVEARILEIADLMRSLGFADDVANSIALRGAGARSAITVDRMSMISGANR